MARVEMVLGFVVLLVWVYSVITCILTPDDQVRGLPKWGWLVLVVVLPVLGSVLWLGVGRSGGVRPPRAAAARPAPRTYRAMTADERIRRMEEDLARLEGEGEQGGARA